MTNAVQNVCRAQPILATLGAALIGLAAGCHARVEAAPGPHLFSVSETVGPGDTADLRGAYLGGDAQVMLLAPGEPQPRRLALTEQNPSLVKFLIPAGLPLGVWAIWVQAGGDRSNTLYVNRADVRIAGSPDVTPGGLLRLWGRNLTIPTGASRVRFKQGGSSLAGEIVQGDQYGLTVRAPAGLQAGADYRVAVSNGLRTPEGETPDALTVRARPAGPDVWHLGVPWAGDFSFSANRYDAATDPRLPAHVSPGGGDVRDALQRDADFVSHSGEGGVLYLPAGTYRLDNTQRTLYLHSHVVLEGEGADRTILQFGEAGTKTPGLTFDGAQRTGLLNLKLQNVNPNDAYNGTLSNSTRSKNAEIFLKNVDFDLGTGDHITLLDVDDLLISDSHFEATSSHRGPFYVQRTTRLTFQNNKVEYHNGRVAFEYTDNGLIEGNHFLRDGAYSHPHTYESGGIEVSFSRDLVVRGNEIRTTGNPEGGNNDSESIMTQRAQVHQFRDVGRSTGAGAGSLSDSTKDWSGVTTFIPLTIVAITEGAALGEWRYVTAHTGDTLTLDRPWDVVPPAGSQYTISSWSANDLFLLGNQVINNKRGIQIYDGGWDCVIADNTLTDSVGIALRATDRIFGSGDPAIPPQVAHDVAWDNSIVGNTITNPQGTRLAQIVVAVAHVNGPLHGNGILATEIRDNTIVSTLRGPSDSLQINSAPQDGVWVQIADQKAARASDTEASVLGTILDDNVVKGLAPEQAYHVDAEIRRHTTVRPKKASE